MPCKNLRRRLFCAAILAALGSQPAVAAKLGAPKPTRPLSCPDTPALPMPAGNLTVENTSDERVHVYADRADAKLDESAHFSGNVELRRGGLHLFADDVLYNQADNTLDASGHIHLRKDSGETIRAPRLSYEIDTERGYTEDAQFAFATNAARGAAERIRLEGRNLMTLESVSYTTCPPGRDDWLLRASTLTLDKASEIGSAWNARISFMHVPIFYSPYLSFPLTDQRKSGFLAPHVGHSSNSGFFLSAPYYFNLAPNYDDTLTSRVLQKRGLQLINEFRYLGKSYSGTLDLEYLPNDRATDSDRQALFFRHRHSLSPLWSAATDIQWVSDTSYLIDLGKGTESSRTHLPRSVSLDYGGSIWRFSGRAFTYQTLDTTIPLAEQPYQRLPQLLLKADSPSGPNRLHSALESEWVNFYRPGFALDVLNVVEPPVAGQRFDVLPSVSLPLRTSYFYFTPKAGYRYTSWRLNWNADAQNPNPDESPERGLPIYSLDSGLAFERAGRMSGQAYTQTLEPRIYYVYIPYQDQDKLPVFDAALPAFSFYNFFRENRFVGADRVGDANQLTAAVTSRFLLANGVEQARVSLGQVSYFADQQVNLPAGTVNQTRSDLIGEVSARLGRSWYLRAGLQWDNKEHDTRRSSVYAHYRPADDTIVNLGYRYTDNLPNSVVQPEGLADISVQWPLTPHWTGVARWNRSLPESRTVQAYAGLQYTSCCWAFRIAARHRLQPDGSVDNSVLFEFDLSGLAKMGDTEEAPLKQGRFIFE
jgi:LPS-assembly protein